MIFNLLNIIPNPNVEKIKIEIDRSKKEHKISLVGDILMDGSVRNHIQALGYDFLFEDVKEIFLEDSLTIGNLETSITNGSNKWPDKYYNFKSDPRNANLMKESGVDVLTLANNHILDYGYAGLLDTIKHLDKAKIDYAGAGKNKDDAIRGSIIEKDGLRIGVLSFSRVVPDVNWYATSKRAGLVGAYDGQLKEVEIKIKSMKEEVDILILGIHWGIEKDFNPREMDKKAAKSFIDAGADIIMGHHPHVLQGIETYKGRPIFYSLGNFIFTGNQSPTIDTVIAQVLIEDKEIVALKILPFQIQRGKPTKMGKDYDRKTIDNINNLSKEFKLKLDETGGYKIKQEGV